MHRILIFYHITIHYTNNDISMTYIHVRPMQRRGFVFVKFPMYAAVVCNKVRTPLHIGQTIGAGCILSVYSLSESLYWGRTAKCENLNITSIHMRQYCTPTIVKTMESQSVSLAFLFLFFLAFTVLLMTLLIVP